MPFLYPSEELQDISTEFNQFIKKNFQVEELAKKFIDCFNNIEKNLDFKNKDDKELALLLLLQGAVSSWTLSYILSCSGDLPSSHTEMRRAIEFTCYAMRINSNERAKDWLDQANNDISARKRFAVSCSIPLCYEKAKYKKLHPLIVQHEVANYFGAHGNIHTFAERIDVINGEISSRIPLDKRLSSTLHILLNAYQIYDVFIEALKPNLNNFEELQNCLKLLKESIHSLEFVLNEEKVSNLQLSIDNPQIEEKFKEIIEEAKSRKKS